MDRAQIQEQASPGGMEFFRKFEEATDLAKNGQWMTSMEKIVTLKSFLHGSKKEIYEDIVERPRGDCIGSGVTKEKADEVHAEIKKRLLEGGKRG